jgi:hypothetical protein
MLCLQARHNDKPVLKTLTDTLGGDEKGPGSYPELKVGL